MRGLDQRLSRLEAGQPLTPPSPADVAATALHMWQLAGMEPPNADDLEREASGGAVRDSAVRPACRHLSEPALRILSTLDQPKAAA